MSPRTRGRAAAALLALGVLGGGVLAAGAAGAAFAAGSGDSGTAPITVTIPGSPKPTPSSKPHKTQHPNPPGGGHGHGGGNGGGHGNGNDNGGGNGQGNGGGGHPPGGNGGGSGQGNGGTPPTKPGSEPPLPKGPVTGAATLKVGPGGVLLPGAAVTASGTGFTPGEKVDVIAFYEHGKAVKIGQVTADAKGAATDAFDLPKLDAGADTIEFTGWDSLKTETGTVLTGRVTLASSTTRNRTLLIDLAGGAAGLGIAAVGVWLGIRAILSVPMTVTKV